MDFRRLTYAVCSLGYQLLRTYLPIGLCLAVGCSLAVGGLLCATTVAEKPATTESSKSTASASPHSVGLADVQWDEDAFWGERLKALRQGTLPTMTDLMFGKDRSHFVENFRIAAGLSEGRQRGPSWNDGDTYKWVEALAATYAQTHDPSLKASMDRAIEVIARAQRDDGYLHTPVIIAARHLANLPENDTSFDRSKAVPFGDPINFEMYNFGHLMTAGAVHFEATGQRTLLDVAIKATDFLDREFSRPDRELARHAICPAHYMGILDLARVTGDRRYIQMAQRFLAMRDLVQGGDDNQDRVPFRQQREAVGHAVRANYLYAGVADLCLAAPDDDLLKALSSCWDSVHQKKIYITGGCGALYDGASPDGSKDQSQITRIHQAYGRNYQLPNSTAHNETCAAIGNVLWNYRMWQLTDQCRTIDALETSLMNAVLAGVSLDGERYFYTNTLRQLKQMPTNLRWSRTRQEWISCYCCPPNVARTVASIGRWAYGINDQSLAVLLYGSNRLKSVLSDGSKIELRQTSRYPIDGQVELQIEAAPQRMFAIRLRIPGWCQSAKVALNGRVVEESAVGGSFVNLNRRWATGDRVQLELSMPVRLMAAHPLVEECRGQVAVQRGPLVYCLESVDLPEQTSVMDCAVTAETTDWQLNIGQGELARLPLLEGRLWLRPSGDSQAKPEDVKSTFNGSPSLYREFTRQPGQPVAARLIPYFAWGNRGESEMTVWIPIEMQDKP